MGKLPSPRKIFLNYNSPTFGHSFHVCVHESLIWDKNIRGINRCKYFIYEKLKSLPLAEFRNICKNTIFLDMIEKVDPLEIEKMESYASMLDGANFEKCISIMRKIHTR